MARPKTRQFDAVLLELIQCSTVTEQLDVLAAHIEQVDEGMIVAVLDDHRCHDLLPQMIAGALKSKGINVDLNALAAQRR